MKECFIRAKQGNKDAFIALINERSTILYRIAYSYLKNSEDAMDAVQDAILIAFKNLKSLKQATKFNAWITSILVNRCKEILRRANRFKLQEYVENVLNNESSAHCLIRGVEAAHTTEVFLLIR